jgi:hypothetical protein
VVCLERRAHRWDLYEERESREIGTTGGKENSLNIPDGAFSHSLDPKRPSAKRPHLYGAASIRAGLPRHAELRAWRQSQGGAAALQLLRSQAPEHMGMALLQILVF